jgi:alpha-D-ribose 1-methylphosphonate 5-triphosphate diphosphatase
VCGKHGLDPAEFDPYVAFLRGLQSEFGTAHEAATVAAATRFGATLASHDDTTAAQVASSHAHGITIAEFPTTVEAAQACHASNIRTMMGAPNLVRGASHSGNVAAQELAQLDRLDMLSSDYVPASLLMGAVQLGALWGDMARGIATVTATPARAVDLHDRGRLEVGLRADVIQFSLQGGFPVLKGAWHAGLQVA